MHKSVLLNESIDGLNIKECGVYIDATVGYAGHSSKILEKIKKRGFLFAFDQDDEALKYSEKLLSSISDNFKLIHDNFKNMNEYITEPVDGILFDLGVSSPEIDNSDRGFSYKLDSELDMRMNKDNELTAKEIVDNYSEEKLVKILFTYGEEKYARSIVKAIINKRKQKEITTTLELADLIKENVPISYRNKKHPARKTFQALRIEVNDEIDILEGSIKEAFKLLKTNGRMCVITFHSLEDRIVKNVFRELSSENALIKKLPEIPKEYKVKAKLITKKPIVPSEKEIKENNRSRSAKLRIIEKI